MKSSLSISEPSGSAAPLRIRTLAARVLEGFREPAAAIADAFAAPAEPALQRVPARRRRRAPAR